jgi:peptidoglycan/LPS O-acetylase OafA/YrhL
MLQFGFETAPLFGVQSVTHGVLGLTFFVLVLMAANGMLPVLRAKPLVWLGSVSYPLYLLHENIGWSLIHWGLAHGLSMNTCVAAALAAVLLLSHAVSRLVEQPTMQWIRTAYRIRKSGAATT